MFYCKWTQISHTGKRQKCDRSIKRLSLVSSHLLNLFRLLRVRVAPGPWPDTRGLPALILTRSTCLDAKRQVTECLILQNGSELANYLSTLIRSNHSVIIQVIEVKRGGGGLLQQISRNAPAIATTGLLCHTSLCFHFCCLQFGVNCLFFFEM